MRVVPANHFFRQGEVMGTGFCRNLDTTGLRFADHTDRSGRADMSEVEARARQLRQRQIACNHHIFRRRGNAGQPQLGGDQAFVHAAAFRQMQILAMIDHREIERQRILHRPAHHQTVHDRAAVV